MSRPSARPPVLAGAVLVLSLLVGVSCRVGENRLAPDAFLQDSLGLGEDERVHRVGLGSEENRERIEPVQLTVRPGDWVEFLTEDHRVHVVRFVLDEAPTSGAARLRASGQEGSPPLVERGARFLVSFQDMPAGTYPFVVSGNGEDGRGTIVVASDED